MSRRTEPASTDIEVMPASAARQQGALAEFNRVLSLMLALLVLGGAWAWMSRIRGAAPASPSAESSPRQGFAAPEFSLDSLDGSRITLSTLRGHPVVLNLWASWCLPCRTEMPGLERVYQEYKDRGVVILGANMTRQDSEEAARSFVEEHALTFPVLLDREGSMQAAYQIVGLPSTYFIDRQGVIRVVVVGGPMSDAAIASRIEDLLAGP